MTLSELYHKFALIGYRTVATRFEGSKIIMEIESNKSLRCPVCDGTNLIRRGCSSRDFQAPPIGHKNIAFIVNEFSPLDADGITMQREHDKVICLPGGSVFCRCLAGQFIQTLKELPVLLDLPQCDGVVVEASGIADPGAAPTINALASRLQSGAFNKA
ncbi:MAG: hypothetical protein KAH38_01020 [Candidatus Hydrogenedentes bacterium]|nr:hypothetical protein [Candidatus Hydrogenedentota bacterium]